ncbi:MAG: cytochrome c oxidase subunit I [SAR202 cluster bacterium]|jgi:cytochrome c oxidase subunit 1|nr:cytochrome c oxidase subunit I [SAR202 cluster bacterium]
MISLTIPIPKRPTHPTGIWNWLTTIDHKRIGILYGVTAFILFLTGGIEALYMRAQLATPEAEIVSPEVFNQLFTMHGTTMIFLAIMPMGTAFFNYIIPLQIGARDVAFPRLNAFSYWTFLAGAIMLKSSWFLGGAPNAGWFGYAPITGVPYNPGHGIDFWILSLQILGIASLAAAFNFVVTIINMRAPGMSLMRMPLFTWMTFVTSLLLILAFPVITVALIELMFDRFYGANFFVPAAGASPLLWQHLFWIFGHPEVYILILPAMGIISEIIPTFSKKPLFGYPVVVLSGVVIAFMGWMVWSHHMFTVGLGPVANSVFALTTMAIAVPTGVKIFSWMGTMWRGSIHFSTAMLFSVGFVALFIIGGLSGVMHSSAASDAQQQDTYFIVAHLHYVLFGGSIMALLAAVYYWFPKITGRLMSESIGKINFWLTFIAMNLTFFPMHFTGLDGMPRRIYTYGTEMGWDLWNAVASMGAFLLAASILVFMHNVVRSYRKGEISGSDPWDGRTLEWSISSPPPEYNFAEIPVVETRDPFWAQKRDSVATARVGGGSGEGEHDIHMPQPSYWPLVVSIGLLIGGYGLIYNVAVAVVGGAIALIAVYAWSFEPVNEPEEH